MDKWNPEWDIVDAGNTWNDDIIEIVDDPDWIEIPLDLKCKDDQFLTVKNHKMICKEYPHIVYKTIDYETTIIKEVPTMTWTIGNIAIVIVICIIVYKLMPKVTLSNFFRAVWKLVIRPFRRKEEAIQQEWRAAERNTETVADFEDTCEEKRSPKDPYM